MTPKELRDLIKNSPYLETLNQLEIKVDFPNIGESYELIGIYNIYNFYYGQYNNWSTKILKNYGSCFRESVNFFYSGLRAIVDFVNRNIIDSSNNTKSSIEHSFNLNVRNQLIPPRDVFSYNAPAVDFLLSVYKFNQSLYQPAFEYITRGSLNSNSKINLNGYFLAYEFENKENSFLFNQRESEKKAIARIRSEISGLSNEYQNEITNF